MGKILQNCRMDFHRARRGLVRDHRRSILLVLLFHLLGWESTAEAFAETAMHLEGEMELKWVRKAGPPTVVHANWSMAMEGRKWKAEMRFDRPLRGYIRREAGFDGAVLYHRADFPESPDSPRRDSVAGIVAAGGATLEPHALFPLCLAYTFTPDASMEQQMRSPVRFPALSPDQAADLHALVRRNEEPPQLPANVVYFQRLLSGDESPGKEPAPTAWTNGMYQVEHWRRIGNRHVPEAFRLDWFAPASLDHGKARGGWKEFHVAVRLKKGSQGKAPEDWRPAIQQKTFVNDMRLNDGLPLHYSISNRWLSWSEVKRTPAYHYRQGPPWWKRWLQSLGLTNLRARLAIPPGWSVLLVAALAVGLVAVVVGFVLWFRR